MRQWATLIGMNEAPPPTLYPVLIIHPWLKLLRFEWKCLLYYSVFWCLSYHTGSLAFGSLILAVVQMIRMVLEYVHTKLKGKLSNLKNTNLSKIIKCPCQMGCWWSIMFSQVLKTHVLDSCFAVSNAASGAWRTSSSSWTEMHTSWWVKKHLLRTDLLQDSISFYTWITCNLAQCVITLLLSHQQIAIYGKNFCTSSKDAFFLLMRNIIR